VNLKYFDTHPPTRAFLVVLWWILFQKYISKLFSSKIENSFGVSFSLMVKNENILLPPPPQDFLVVLL
jgi:hypothetical protein